jgi:DNA-binding NtrC family response regulator
MPPAIQSNEALTGFPNTIRVARDREVSESRLVAVILGDGIFQTHPLPAEGDVAIGRTPASDIQIDHPSISRRHAVLHLGPSFMTIEDQGSANGTWRAGEYLAAGQPAALRPGELVDLGAILLVVQPRVTPGRPRRLSGRIERWLEEECARAASGRTPFAVLCVTVESRSSREAVETALAETLRPTDVWGAEGPAQLAALLVDADPTAAAGTASRLTAALARRGAFARVSLACCPRDGRSPAALLARLGAAEEPPERPMDALYRLVERVAQGKINVLILGETGSGKEVLAKRIHHLSPRKSKPLVCLNSAALSETLLESELFGHERGAFTGAHQAKQGLLETARGGTVFLDEVGELPMSIQVKLLRVIEEQCVMPVGGVKPRPIDVRFICATNRDLEAEVARGTFRQDLFFRLNGITLHIPTLRERVPEIVPLAREFAQAAVLRNGAERIPELSPEAISLLQRYSWPGNIRELRNVIERAVLLCGDGRIELEHLPAEKLAGPPAPPIAVAAASPEPVPAPAWRPREAAPPPPPPPDAEEPISEHVRREIELIEKKRILEALNRCSWNQTLAAEILGITRRTLGNKLNRYQIPRPRKRRLPPS